MIIYNVSHETIMSDTKSFNFFKIIQCYRCFVIRTNNINVSHETIKQINCA